MRACVRAPRPVCEIDHELKQKLKLCVHVASSVYAHICACPEMAEASQETVGDSVADLTLRDEEGVEVRFGALYKDKRALIVFVRVTYVYTAVHTTHLIRIICIYLSAFSLIRLQGVHRG